MSCEFEEEVSAWFDGELPEFEAARVRAHVAECRSCTDLLADFESVRESVRALRDLPAGDAPRPPLWQRQIRVPLPLAAVLAIVLFGAPFVAFHRGVRARPEPRAAIVRPAGASLLARYDGGGRAVITVRPKERGR